MKDKLMFIKLPIVLLVIAFAGRLAIGAGAGVNAQTYETANRLFSLVILQVHLALFFGAMGRAYHGFRAGSAFVTGAMIGVASQILVLAGTVLSYVAGMDTFFNFPAALNATEAVPFGTAFGIRAGGLVVNALFAGVAGLIGWAAGALLPAKRQA